VGVGAEAVLSRASILKGFVDHPRPRLSRHLKWHIFHRSIAYTIHVAAVVAPVSPLAPFHQTTTTPVRKIGGGSTEVYEPLKTDPEGLEPVKVDPDEVKSSIPAEDKLRNSPAPAQSPMNLSPPTKLYPPPQKRVPAPIPRSPGENAARSSLVPSPITQPVPTPGSLPGPPTWNNLKSQRSVPTLLSVSQWPSWTRTQTDRTLV